MADEPERHRHANSRNSRFDRLVQPTVRVVLALAILLIFRSLLTQVPGTGQVVLEPDVTIATILHGVLTLIMFGAIINYVADVGAVLAVTYDGFPELERITLLTGLLLVIIWAYQIFFWLPFFRTNEAYYDYLFVFLGVLVGGWLGYELYSNTDKMSALFTKRAIGTPVGNTADRGVHPGDGGGKPGNVPVSEGQEDLPPGDETEPMACPTCGAETNPGERFCSACGAELADAQGNNPLGR